jgi:hypothetical protein
MDFIFSHKGRILKKYGASEGERILALIDALKKERGGETYFIDELEAENSQFQCIEEVDPVKFREFLNFVERDSTVVNTSLIIGGHDIIPLWEVPNPAHDDDLEILGDAAYASRDDDFLVPQRSIGRIPDTADAHDEFFAEVLQKTVQYHQGQHGFDKSFGYSASIWKRASEAVFQIIGDKDKVRLSPPLSSDDLDHAWLRKQLLYFNLHGSKETANWYGQRAPEDPPGFAEFPVAINPENVPALKRSCVYSEACYGGWIKDKERHESMALTFMAQGSIAFVGSTAIAYGPIEPPSGEADLLGRYFFEYVLRGIPFGDALRHAKTDFARTMILAQGFLDSDDKKTLLEFQLYGDPLLSLLARHTQ